MTWQQKAWMRGACLCDGRYEECNHPDPCGGLNDRTGRGPWCEPCQSRRLETIKASLATLTTTFEKMQSGIPAIEA